MLHENNMFYIYSGDLANNESNNIWKQSQISLCFHAKGCFPRIEDSNEHKLLLSHSGVQFEIPLIDIIGEATYYHMFPNFSMWPPMSLFIHLFFCLLSLFFFFFVFFLFFFFLK